MVSYRNLAIDALSKACSYDPYFPKSEAMVSAWAEALEDAGIDSQEDVLMAVRVMYRNYGDPGWKPTPRVLVATAKEVRKLRREREAKNEAKQIDGPRKVTYAEFRKRHPDVEFPTFGKDASNA